MEKYIDCVDTFRINIIKEQVECERKEKRKEEQDIVEQFLKSEVRDLWGMVQNVFKKLDNTKFLSFAAP